MKKVLSMMLALTMLLGLTSTAFAAFAQTDTNQYNIAVTSVTYSLRDNGQGTLTIVGTCNNGYEDAVGAGVYNSETQSSSSNSGSAKSTKVSDGNWQIVINGKSTPGKKMDAGDWYLVIDTSGAASPSSANNATQYLKTKFTVGEDGQISDMNAFNMPGSANPTGTATITLGGNGASNDTGAVESQSTNITLTANANGVAASGDKVFQWYKGNTLLTSETTGYTGTDSSTLTITTYNNTFAGEYTCKVFNQESGKGLSENSVDATKTLTTTKIAQATVSGTAGTPTTTTIPVTVSGGSGTGKYYAIAVASTASEPAFSADSWTEAGSNNIATISGLTADTEYKVYVARAGDDDYNVSAVAQVGGGTIKTDDGVDVGTFTNITKTYDGKALVPTFTPVAGVSAGDYTIEYSSDGGTSWTAAAPTNATTDGNYKVRATTTKVGYKNTAEVVLTINKADADIEFTPSSLTAGSIGEVTAKVVLDPTAQLEVKYGVKDDQGAETFKAYADAQEYLNSLNAEDTFIVKVEIYAGNDNVEALGAQGATAEFTVGSKSSGIIISSGNKKPEEKPEEKPAPERETYVAGNPDGSFAPSRSITRGELATMLARLSKDYDADTSYSTAAVDVGNSYYTNPMNYMASIGVINGYTDGSIRPGDSCTRAEFATMLCRLLDMSPVTTARFSDVSANDWYAGYIGALANAGIISGYTDGTCGPDHQITRAEAVAMINRAFDLSAHSDGEFTTVPTDMTAAHWAYNEVLVAMNTDVSEVKK